MEENEKKCEHECACHCHTEKGKKMKLGKMHISPCCDGPCGLCGKSINHGKTKEHLRGCHNQEQYKKNRKGRK